MTQIARTATLAGFLLCALGGCTGEVRGNLAGKNAPSGLGSGGPGSDGPVGANPGGAALTCDMGADPGVSPLLKLSTVQYRNTVRDLLAAVGASAALPSVQGPLASVPDDSLGDGFRGLDNRTALEHVQGYFDVGVALGDAVAKDPTLLTAVAGECATAATLSDACVNAFLDRFVRLVYRKPLTDADRQDYLSLNDGKRAPADAVRAMIVVAMSSPRLVNHLEIDGEFINGAKDRLELSAYEIASRLSYTFWQTLPDAALFAAADDGSLATDAGFATQLERVFADPRTHDTLWQFWNEWLGFEKFTGFETERPAFKALAAGESIGQPGHDYYGDMVQEMHDLTDLFTFGRESTLADLLSTDLSVTQSADLAHLYGVTPWSGTGDYPTLPAGTRAGLFQRAALLVSNLEGTNPFHRGALVRRSLLCDALPQPDPNALPPGSLDPPPFDPNQTTRQRYQAKIEGNSLCTTCHGSFASIGYVLESFDALGRYRTTETVFDAETGAKLAELPIDSSADTHIDATDTTTTSNAAELNQKLIASQKVEACFAQKYFQYAARRDPTDASLDSCVILDLTTALKDPKVGIAGAFRRLAQYSSFFQRKVGPQ